jgi:Holliday junction DNA helicase RuvB
MRDVYRLININARAVCLDDDPVCQAFFLVMPVVWVGDSTDHFRSYKLDYGAIADGSEGLPGVDFRCDGGWTSPLCSGGEWSGGAFTLSLWIALIILCPMAERLISDVLAKPDAALEVTLRPSVFADFTGQAKVKERVELAVAAARQRGEALDHVLLSGPPGLGKTTIANIIAKAMGTTLKATSGPTIEKAGDLAGLLTNLAEGDVLFVDEIHRLQKTIEEYLYPAMEDFKLDIIIDQGPNARSVRLNLPHFTLIGATTRSGLLTAPLLTRFPVRERLDYYEAEQLQTIVVRSARLLSIAIEEAGANEIARRSRGTPRIANNLLRRVRDYAQVRGDGRITVETADRALAMLEIDENGLDEMDKRILEAVITKFSGGPVGLNSLAVAVGEESDTLEEVYEPYLIMEGYLKRTSQGRVATELSYRKLGLGGAVAGQAGLL